MKYTIEGLQQESLLKYNLDSTDAIILRYIIDFYLTDKMVKEIHNNKEYFWLSYKSLLSEIPVINIKNTDNLARRLKKYVDNNIMQMWVQKSHKGTYTFYRFTDNFNEFIYHPTQKSTPPDSKVVCAPDSKVDPKDPSTNDPSTKDHALSYILNILYAYMNKFNLLSVNPSKRQYEENQDIITLQALLVKFKPFQILAAADWAGNDKFWAVHLKPKNLQEIINQFKAQPNSIVADYIKIWQEKCEKEIK